MALFGTTPPVSRLDELKRLLVKDPTSRQFLALAEEYRKQGKLRDAVVTLERGIQIHTTSVAAFVGLGKTYQQLERPEDAIRAFQNALKIDRENLVAIRHLAEVYLAKGDRVEAIKKLKLYAGLKPGDKDVAETIGRLDAELGAIMAAARERSATRPGGRQRPVDLYSEIGIPRPTPPPLFHSHVGARPAGVPRPEPADLPPPPLLHEPDAPPLGPSAARAHDEPLWESFAAQDASEPSPPPPAPSLTPPPAERRKEPSPMEMTYDGSLLSAAVSSATAPLPAKAPPPKVSPMEMTFEGSFLAAKTAPPGPPPGSSSTQRAPESVSGAPLPLQALETREVRPAAPAEPYEDASASEEEAEAVTKIIRIVPMAPPARTTLGHAETSTAPLKVQAERAAEPPPFAEAEAAAASEPDLDLFEPSLEPPRGRRSASEVPILSTALFEESELPVEPVLPVEPEVSESPALLEMQSAAPAAPEPAVIAPAHMALEEVSPKPEPAPAAAPIVTETLADLYRAQGHVDDARDTYRALAASVPDETRAQELLLKAEELPVDAPGVRRLRAFAARFPEEEGQAPKDIGSFLRALVAMPIGIRAAALADREGLAVVAAGDTPGAGASVEGLAAELTSFLKSVQRTEGEVGEGPLRTLSLISENGGAVVSRVTSEYALILHLHRGASAGEVRYQAARAARALRPTVG